MITDEEYNKLRRQIIMAMFSYAAYSRKKGLSYLDKKTHAENLADHSLARIFGPPQHRPEQTIKASGH